MGLCGEWTDCDECTGVLLYNAAQAVFVGKAAFSVESGTDKPTEKRQERDFPEPDVLSTEQTTGRDGKPIVGVVMVMLTSFVIFRSQKCCLQEGSSLVKVS